MAQSAIEVCERNTLVSQIKKISAHYGGDDMAWLKEYAVEMIKERPRKETLACFESLVSQLTKKVWAGNRNGF